AAAAAG
nr:Chain D, Unknown peptide [synthetic construct]